MKLYSIETNIVTPIYYKRLNIEGAWRSDKGNREQTVSSVVFIPEYPEVEIPDEAICVSIESERMRSKDENEPFSMRLCRVLYLMPVGLKEAQP